MPFCPYVEDGNVAVSIGATTENPSFELNNALLSRAARLMAQVRWSDALAALLDRARLDVDRAAWAAQFEGIRNGGQRIVLEAVTVDARRVLNLAGDCRRPGGTTVGAHRRPRWQVIC